MKIKSLIAGFSLASIIFITGCTDATQSQIMSLGNIHQVKCYSGGVEIFNDYSTGKVNDESGNGIGYESYYTKQYVNTYADCIVHTMPNNFVPPSKSE
ncbi:outer membrane lipoprotein [Klebsiella phage K64-1]|uniref:outer membrane lipoprotein n=1 Tax=Klebsiella phage K64-1 TaxID=1439894 RepID=UPI0018A5B14B|nr:outer membrane lipoprotein [Klebsiella phage K64-1]QOE32350.1 putative outer membrane lipoprotein [Klebsiella phage Muenster]